MPDPHLKCAWPGCGRVYVVQSLLEDHEDEHLEDVDDDELEA